MRLHTKNLYKEKSNEGELDMKLLAILTVCFMFYGSITSVAHTYRLFTIVRGGDSSSISYGSTSEELEPIKRLQ